LRARHLLEETMKLKTEAGFATASALLMVVTGTVVGVAACGDEGTTPKCPELPLYDVRDASAADKQARQAAADENCVTAAGTASTSTPDAQGPVDSGSD
jgi:hypothetical protein